ncbi:hypothetical protein SETIT_2G102000v2 [Setaria italica]|uniref:Uncharacterized protein n=1 Tax=Setaria italica TaxID=4555 RepID=A0A368PX49_SETIT|nr:hypothetical protein SETIT_2G102000v2 [Setaria italica]
MELLAYSQVQTTRPTQPRAHKPTGPANLSSAMRLGSAPNPPLARFSSHPCVPPASAWPLIAPLLSGRRNHRTKARSVRRPQSRAERCSLRRWRCPIPHMQFPGSCHQ